MMSGDLFPLSLYGSQISYFTGKLEMYFRVRGIPYELKPLKTGAVADEIYQALGSTQMPALRLADGRWMSDSTATIQWFDESFPPGALTPTEPILRFFSLLLEDYADEWLWRPAMHYRWYYPLGAHYAGQLLAEEVAADSRIPVVIRRHVITSRQHRGYTTGDGITATAVPGVEAIYYEALDQLQAIFELRPFILGDAPSLADIGFSGPMFRHFGLDPVPAEIMRRRAPAVYAWLGRLWNFPAQVQAGREPWPGMLPEDCMPILATIGRAYLPYLNANIRAVARGQRRFDVSIDGVSYRGARVSRYRIWCLQRLRQAFAAMPEEAQRSTREVLEEAGAWAPLWAEAELPIDAALCSGLPFHVDAKMIEVYR